MSASRRKQHKSRLKDFDVTDFLPSQENGMASAVAALLARSPEPQSEPGSTEDSGAAPIPLEPTATNPVGVEPIGIETIGVTTRVAAELLDAAEVTAEQQGDITAFTPIGTTPIVSTPAGVSPSVVEPIGLLPTGAIPTSPAPTGNLVNLPNLGDVLAQLATAARPARSRGKYMRATKVEDGHSATQNALYWYLWRQGQHVKGSRSRFVQAGYGLIQAALKIDRSNIQDAIRELQKKHSIRVVQSSTVGTATVYEVFSCDDILVKRRELGLLWVQRFGTRRVDFVSEKDVDTTASAVATGVDDRGLTPIGTIPIGSSAAGLTPGMGSTPTDPIGAAPTEGVGITPIQVVNGVKSSKTTTAAIATIVNAIRSEFGQADDHAARRIIEECRRRASDVTDSEIALQVRLQAKRLRGISSVENPIGLLITQVPKCFEGESFRQFRSGSARGKGGEEEPVQFPTEQQLEEYQAIVEDPLASQSEKRIAQNLLRLGQKGWKNQ